MNENTRPNERTYTDQSILDGLLLRLANSIAEKEREILLAQGAIAEMTSILSTLKAQRAHVR
jgi:hypothetical protein